MTPFAGLRRATILPILCMGLLSLSGCGPRTVTLKGTVALPANVTLQDTDSLMITFVPEAKDGAGASSVVKPSDKSFTVAPIDGKGLSPGKYNVLVKITPYPGPDAQKNAAAFGELNSKYGTGGMPFTVTDEPIQNVVIDLSAGTITKK